MNPSPTPQTLPMSRGSTITRRLASKVLSLIEKYESLSLSSTRNEAPPLQKPTHLAAHSAFHRLGKSVLARARLFIESATDQTKSNRKLEMIAPPKKRVLPLPSKKSKHRATKNESNGFDHHSISSTTVDTNSSLATSTPPVARILPSSFFNRLASPSEQPLSRGNLNPHKWRKRITPPSSRVRDFQVSVGRKGPTFAGIMKRLKPPKVSVRDLTERFQEAGGACLCGDLGEADKSFRVTPREQVVSREGELSSRGFMCGDLEPRDGDRSLGELLRDQSSAYFGTYGDFSYETPRKCDLNESSTILGAAQVVCRDDLNYLNTNFEYMADGSLSNFGYFLRRLESEVETPRPELEIGTTYASTFFTALTQIDPQEPKTTKVYRKTPPPSEFSLGPENRKVRGEVVGGQEKRVFYTKKLLRTMNIVSPTPMNAVQVAQVRGMAFRYT